MNEKKPSAADPAPVSLEIVDAAIACGEAVQQLRAAQLQFRAALKYAYAIRDGQLTQAMAKLLRSRAALDRLTAQQRAQVAA